MQRTARQPLSGRQAEIAAAIVAGKSNREIAVALFLSPRTVENHVAAIFNKLDVGSRVELVTTLLGVENRSGDPTAAQAVRSNLPAERTALVGREVEIASVVRLTRENRLVTVTGAGGIGKTRLALAVGAACLEATFGAWLVELAPVTDGRFVPSAVAQSLDLQEAPGRPLLGTLIAHLKHKALLLILDNCEHVIGAAATLADGLLRECPQLRILATSRESLRIAGEQTYRLPSLAVPEPQIAATLNRENATHYSAVELFAERARATDRAFVLGDDNAPIVAEICRRLDGIPLAIELAAARVKILSLRALSAKLDQRFRVLTGGERTALPRHQTIRALIDWSYDLLAPAERLLFERLSVVTGGCDLAAATALYSDDVSELDVLALLSSLVDKSLVAADFAQGESRYRLLETSRHYALEKLAQRGETARTAGRHARTYLTLAEQLEREFDTVPDTAWFERAEAELDNWRAALDWSFGPAGDALVGARLAAALAPVWANFSLSEGRRRVRVALESCNGQPLPDVVANLEYAAAVIALGLGEWEAALAGSEPLISVYRELGNAVRVVRAECAAGATLVCLGRAAESEPLLKSAIAAARTLGTPALAGAALKNLSYARSLAGNLFDARRHIAEAREIWHAVGAERYAADATVVLAEAEFLAGNHERALELASESVTTLRAIHFTRLLTPALLNYGAYLIACGHWAEARAAGREALGLAQETQRNVWPVWALQHLAAVAALAPADAFAASGAADGGLPRDGLAALAARLLGYVDARIVAFGAFREFTEQHEYDRARAALQRSLGSTFLDEFMSAGATLTQEAAIEAALSL